MASFVLCFAHTHTHTNTRNSFIFVSWLGRWPSVDCQLKSIDNRVQQANARVSERQRIRIDIWLCSCSTSICGIFIKL